MADQRNVRPGYEVVYPNRDKPAAKLVKAIVGIIMLVSVALMLLITIGGWSELQGLKGVNLLWCALYIILAFFIWTRWARGLLPIAAGFATLVLMLAIVAGTGVAGTSWFNRSAFGFAPAYTIFGGKGLTPDLLGAVTVLLIPVQILLIVFAMVGFQQGWNVEEERPKDKSKRGQQGSAEPATA